MVLAIISHTEHFIDSDGTIVGWGATIREINHLSTIFDEVIHVAPLYNGNAPAGMLPYESNRIKFIALKPTGGETFVKKIEILFRAKHNLKTMSQALEQCDIFQFRAPTGMGIYMIPFLLKSKRKGWFKYAGNWAQINPPLGYRIQRYYLKSQTKRIVTINGTWPDQRKNQLTFENPCLTSEERVIGKKVIQNKNYSGRLDFVFIGRLEDPKGVQRILNTFSKIKNQRIGKIHFVGDGPKRPAYETYVENHQLGNVIFHGYLTRDQINSLLEKSHVFLLPSSASEGFPKVIAEAANYGLIPIVSDVSAIGQYIIDEMTGFVVKSAHEALLYDKICHVLDMDNESFKRIAMKSYCMAEKFTYDYYNRRIENEIITYAQN